MTNLMKDERLQLSHKSSENILFFVGKVMDNYSKFDVTVSLQSIPFPHKAFVCMSLHILENICNVCISDQCLNWKKKRKKKIIPQCKKLHKAFGSHFSPLLLAVTGTSTSASYDSPQALKFIHFHHKS